MNFVHKPVLFNKTIELLDVKPNGVYIDGTAGGGGHSETILKKLKNGLLISIDQDPDAILAIKKRLSKYSCSKIVQSNFSNMQEIVNNFDVDGVDGILLDIGVSSHQFDTAQRGFSYRYDSPLDMRMSQKGISAKDLVNTLNWQELAKIFSCYGEEKFAKSIAKAIIRYREIEEIITTNQLTNIIKNAVPELYKRKCGHPSKKTFQALRIAVNNELDNLSKGLDAAFSILKPGGRLVVITFHSLEDRMVKQRILSWSKGCICPKDFPVCVCGNLPKAQNLTKKPIEATKEELDDNPRSKSAKLRGCIKLR